MAIVRANYEFIYCDVGTNGRVFNGRIINNTKFYEKLVNKNLRILGPRYISNSNRALRYVFVDDEAFSMRSDLIKLYSRKTLNKELRIFNYCLSRAQRVVENTFGILASRFPIFHTTINLKLDNIDIIVLTCCALHIFLRRRRPQIYTSPESMDSENIDECFVELGERCDPELMHNLMHNLQHGTRGQISNSAKIVRNEFNQYFNNEGSVS